MKEVALHRNSRLVGGFLALLLLGVLTACGAVSSPSSGNTGANGAGTTNTSATATAPPAGSSSSTRNGCPSQQAPAAASSAADVTVKQAGTANGEPVALKKGQTLEILLPATYHWRLGTSNFGGTLTDMKPEGWYDVATQSCAWRFTGANTGTVPLNFGATPVCDPGKMCPALAFDVSYSVSVS
jgi:hypothetical protein